MNWQSIYAFLAIMGGIITFCAALVWGGGEGEKRADTPRIVTIIFLALTALFGSLAVGMMK